MKIVTIQSDCLYAVKEENAEFDEYNRIFEEYGDFTNVHIFFEKYKYQIGDYFVKEFRLDRLETEAYAQKVVEDAAKLEDLLEDLIDNTIDKKSPNLRSKFITLEGYEDKEQPALKSYGVDYPSMLRVYAVEVDEKSLIIFYSGIKITHKIKDCPILKDNVLQKANKLIAFLEENEISTTDKLIRWIRKDEKDGN